MTVETFFRLGFKRLGGDTTPKEDITGGGGNDTLNQDKVKIYIGIGKKASLVEAFPLVSKFTNEVGFVLLSDYPNNFFLAFLPN